MKKSSSILFLMAFAVASSVQAAEYKVDQSHSQVAFGVRHLVSKTKGMFKDFDGTFSFDPDKPTASTGKFVVKTASISTDNDKRDEHLRGADFFDVQKYPEMTVANVKVTPGKGKHKYKATGDLTLHGVTKSVTFDLEYTGTAKDPWGNTRAGFSAEGKINRKDFGIVWNKTLDAGGLMLGEEVAIELNIEAIQEKAAEAAKTEGKKSEEKK
jgi:polyisoprenoid-binding protein YceI